MTIISIKYSLDTDVTCIIDASIFVDVSFDHHGFEVLLGKVDSEFNHGSVKFALGNVTVSVPVKHLRMSGIALRYLNTGLLLIIDLLNLNIYLNLNIDSTGSLPQIHPSNIPIHIYPQLFHYDGRLSQWRSIKLIY